MPRGVLAVKADGSVTYCTASDDMRGKGRCNHIAHQKPGQSINDFFASIESIIKVDDGSVSEEDFSLAALDQTQMIRALVAENGILTEDPDWRSTIESIENPFNIGKDDYYEEAKMVDFSAEPEGEMLHLVAKYEFRGKVYNCDFGEVPKVNVDGTITINGVNWRVLPVVDQHKAGVISYGNNVVIRQANDNVAITIPKDGDLTTCKVLGKEVEMSTIEHFLTTGDETGLTTGQVYVLKNIDPIAFQRFPTLREDLTQLKTLPPDEPADLAWRRCLTYEEIVKDQYRLQMRRMGVTFRTNLNKRAIYLSKHPDATEEELDERFPLFYQVNITSNIKKDLISRSNVQFSDSLNPISALSQSRKISFTGPGGFNKDSAPYSLRMPHMSHKDVIDSMDTSSGKNVGLTATLSGGYIGSDRMIHRGGDFITPSDFIPYLHNDDPTRASMAVAHLKQSCPIVGGEDPVVKTPAWDKISGAKLGANLTIAYVPMAGNFEDAVVISESAAEKMKTIKAQRYGGSAKGLQVGQRVERKQMVNGQEIRVGGVVSSIDNDGFTVETVYNMTPGDKLSNRHGGKSVVSKVLPDDQMPKIINEDGVEVPVQVVMSPLSISGRKNLGAIMEMNEAYDGKKGVNVTRDLVYGGHRIQASAGKQFIMRLNHLAEEKLSSAADEENASRESVGARFGEMESILLSTNQDRLKILRYLRHQENQDSHVKLNHLMKAIGVDMTISEMED